MGSSRQTDLLSAGFEGGPPAPSADAGDGAARPAGAPEAAPPQGPTAAEGAVLTVSDLTSRVKALLDGDRALSDVAVSGELSNVSHHPSGHLYFTLKDERCQLRCVMFRRARTRLSFTPEDGLAVVARGAVSVYERGGAYQLYVESLTPAGRGGLYEAFERLKLRLEAEGLFDPARKRHLPRFPARIGVVTSPAGAAVRDILKVLGRRWPLASVLVAPVRVQGEGAAGEVAAAVDALGASGGLDVVIVARGGGSIEDLWAFNEEAVARAIARCPRPVITGIGHETDFTIADFAADLRAPTPSAAAELAVPDAAELRRSVADRSLRCSAAARSRLRAARGGAELCRSRLRSSDPRRRVSAARQAADQLVLQSTAAVRSRLAARRSALAAASARLAALDARAVLGRGFAIPLKGGRVVRSAAEVAPGDELRTVLARGALVSVVSRTEEG